jgi:hypothetical protein
MNADNNMLILCVVSLQLLQNFLMWLTYILFQICDLNLKFAHASGTTNCYHHHHSTISVCSTYYFTKCFTLQKNILRALPVSH